MGWANSCMGCAKNYERKMLRGSFLQTRTGSVFKRHSLSTLYNSANIYCLPCERRCWILLSSDDVSLWCDCTAYHSASRPEICKKPSRKCETYFQSTTNNSNSLFWHNTPCDTNLPVHTEPPKTLPKGVYALWRVLTVLRVNWRHAFLRLAFCC